jgi:hypothetical protein
MPAIDLNDEILETLSEAAVEIANLSGPENVVCRRLRALERKLAPQSVTVGELAQRIDVTPSEVLEAACAAGIRPFWHEGQQFRDAAYLRTYLQQRFYHDPAREIEFNVTPLTAELLAEKLSVTSEELLMDAGAAPNRSIPGPRKFVASESRFPEEAATNRRREQTG